MTERYPKRAELRRGRQVTLRELAAADEEAVVRFFERLPPDYTEYQNEHLCEGEIARRFVHSHRPGELWSVLAIDASGEAVGLASLFSSSRGWRRHVGEVRVVVAPAAERHGIAATLVREVVAHAQAGGLEKLQALVLDSQAGLRKAIERLGFREEATLQSHALDHHGARHDLLIYVHDVAEIGRRLEQILTELGVRIEPRSSVGRRLEGSG